MNDITAQELKERISHGDVLNIIDVREPYEYDEANINGTLVPLGDLQARIDDFDDLIDQEIIIHCRSGARSSAAKAFMVQNGFTNVRNLIGGITAYLELA
ncbi:MAG: rhodanese-like domain-containing protein [Bacteroidota bacterium]|nr:rhodanese-like domain-containing protein [Bacteroidota bacterium]